MGRGAKLASLLGCGSLGKPPLRRFLRLQSTREYYEQALFQEMKRCQALQDYVMQLEGRCPPGQDVQVPGWDWSGHRWGAEAAFRLDGSRIGGGEAAIRFLGQQPPPQEQDFSGHRKRSWPRKPTLTIRRNQERLSRVPPLLSAKQVWAGVLLPLPLPALTSASGASLRSPEHCSPTPGRNFQLPPGSPALPKGA